MEIILTKDYATLGYEGDICKVKDGYARNYLIPKQIAVVKNRASLKTLEQMQKNLEKKRSKRVMEAEALKGKIIELKLVIPVKVADNGKLYGSVSQQVIVDKLKAQEIEINKRDVHMEHHIKDLGHYEIEIKLYHGVTAIIKLDVIDIEAKENPIKTEAVVDTEAKENPVKTEAIVDTEDKENPVKTEAIVDTEDKENPVKTEAIVDIEDKENPAKTEAIVDIEDKENPAKTIEEATI